MSSAGGGWVVTAAKVPEIRIVTCLDEEGEKGARSEGGLILTLTSPLILNPNPNPDLGKEGVQRGVEGVEGQAGLAGVLLQRQRVELEEHLVRVACCWRLIRQHEQSGWDAMHY